MDGTPQENSPVTRSQRVRFAENVRRLGRLMVACLLMGAVVSIATPLAGAAFYPGSGHVGRHHHHRRHHHQHRHHRHHHRRHHGRRIGAHTTSDKWSATAPCANADTSSTSATLAQMDEAVACLVNQERLKFGLPTLSVSPDLNNSAQGWTENMVATGQFMHGSDQAFSNRLLAAGYDWGQGGENIATGFLTPRDAVSAWMGSQEHCQNVLSPDYRNFGTGEDPAPVGNYAAAPATWTQDFGTLMGQNSPSSNYGPANGCPYNIPASATPSNSSASGSSSSSGS